MAAVVVSAAGAVVPAAVAVVGVVADTVVADIAKYQVPETLKRLLAWRPFFF
jgi:hypothetical protein